jgi:hypothetical protein
MLKSVRELKYIPTLQVSSAEREKEFNNNSNIKADKILFIKLYDI